MRSTKKSPNKPALDGLSNWRTALWLLVFGGALFFWPACLDRYLAPRFCFLSAALITAVLLVWKDLRQNPGEAWHWFDLLLLGWYGFNLASISWSMSTSEGLFYAQKTFLLFGVYWFFRQTLLRHEALFRKTLGQITLVMTGLVCLILFVQLGMAAQEKGLDNQSLYDYASGVFGNKSLAAEFLFCLLVLQVLFVAPMPGIRQKPWILWSICGLLLLLILILQVRTALVASVIGAGFYAVLRASFEPDFRKIFIRKIMPAGVVLLGLFVALMAWKGAGDSFAERINPLNYLESATSNERRFVWYKTDLLNAEHYWLGVGNGSWKFWLPSKNLQGGYRQEEQNIVFTRAHNDYLEIRAEMGMLGAVWFCSLFGLAFLVALLALRNNQKTGQNASNHDLMAAAAGLLGYCIIQYFDFPRERIEFQMVLALFFALLIHHSRGIWPKTAQQNTKNLQIPLMGWLLAGLSFNLILGGQRMRGEIHNVRLLDAQARGDWRKVAEESKLAENTFYQYTDSAMPLAWHEGVAWYQLKQPEKAVAALERACQLNPWSFQVLNNYATGLVNLKRYQEAIPLFEKALTINPQYDEGKFNLSFVYYQMADYPKAESWLARVDTISNPATAADQEKNRAILNRLREFRKAVEEKRR